MVLNNNNKNLPNVGGNTKQFRKSHTVQLSQITTYTGVHPSHFFFTPQKSSELEQRVGLKKMTEIYNTVISFKKDKRRAVRGSGHKSSMESKIVSLWQ